MFGPKPDSWTFPLDQRATHMSLIEMDETTEPIFATPDSIQKLVNGFPRDPHTPAEVIALLDIGNKLFITAVIYYEFAAVSVEKSLQAFELAVRMYLSAGANVNFGKLIRRLEDEGTFTDEQIMLFTLGRKLRNSFAHPQYVNAIPLVMVSRFLRTTHQLIAILYQGKD